MNSFWIGVLGLVIVLVSALLIRKILAPSLPFTDFLVGDDKKYSLSRFQAALWAYIIISYQTSTIIILFIRGKMEEFELVFSEETIWLLGLSLGSYVISKGIVVNQMSTGQFNKDKLKTEKKRSDLITGDYGLDLSRFQMLIWTLIAVSVFVVDYFGYLNEVSQAGDVSVYFPKFGDNNGILPSIDMSFIVLMGLSQGAYIGRKLVPSHKVKEFTDEFKEDLTVRINALETTITLKEAECEIMKSSPDISEEEKLNAIEALKKIKKQKSKAERELSDIKSNTAN